MYILLQTSLKDRERIYSLRGICMILIICHHVFNYVEGKPECLWIMSHWGYLATSVFLFLSGFGTFLSLKDKDCVSFKWIYSKTWHIIKAVLFLFAVYTMIWLWYNPLELSLNLILNEFILLSLPNESLWFIKAILLCYIAVYIIFNIAKVAIYRFAFITILSLFVFIYGIFNWPVYWINTILSFPIGVAIALIYNILPPPYQLCSLKGLCIFSIAFILFACPFALRCYSWINSLLVLPITTLFALYFNINNNLLSYIGKKSLNFYLFQWIGLIFVNGDFPFFVNILLVFLLTFILSVVYENIILKF